MKIAAEQRLQLLWKPFRGAELCRAVETALTSSELAQRVEDPVSPLVQSIRRRKKA